MSTITAHAALGSRAPLALLGVAGLALALAVSTVVLLRAPVPASAGVAPVANVMGTVERRAVAENGSMDVQAILGTPAYFRFTGQPQLIERHAADRDVVVILAEDLHAGELPALPRPTMVIDGRAYAPSRASILIEGAHHRVSLLVYSDPTRALAADLEVAELQLRGAVGDLRWERPYGGPATDAPLLSIPLFLALLGGMLASMWPCLFQLTAYFLPSVAGLSMEEARTGRADRAVLRTAVLFVSGIVIVYTIAGFAAGVAAQSIAGTSLFESARQPLTLVAGLVIIGMAARLALRARRPLVCHMPTSSPTKRGGIGTVVLGLAFATGCMTCFGAAVVLGMFTYVFTTASPLVGAAILFVFSLGIAVPLVIAAVAMARVLPLIARLERAAPALTLVSAAIMAGYGVLLVTGTSHLISNTFARLARVIG